MPDASSRKKRSFCLLCAHAYIPSVDALACTARKQPKIMISKGKDVGR